MKEFKVQGSEFKENLGFGVRASMFKVHKRICVHPPDLRSAVIIGMRREA